MKEKSQYEEKMKIHRFEVEKYEEKILSFNQKITNVIEKDHEFEISSLGEIKKEKVDEINKRAQTAFQQIKQVVVEKEKEIENQIQGELEELKEEKSNLHQEIERREEVSKKIKEAEEAIGNLENQKSYNNKLLEDVEQSEFDKSQTNSYLNRLVTLQNETDELDRESNSLKRRVTILEFWKKAYSPSGIPSILIDEAIPFMNERISEYLEKLTNGRYIVSFDTLDATKSGEFRDKISVNVLDTLTRANARIKLSGGQTRIIDIATILTLRDLQSNVQDVNFNILIFDEIFDSLDEENIGFVSKVLSQLKLGKSIYLISHQHQDQLEADETLELR
jgi:DNA repair exonuclease SbcCD ATPase subunit